MKLDWITPHVAGQLWGVTERQVQALCMAGKIRGAVKLGRVWLIPKNTAKPIDGRTKAGRKVLSGITANGEKNDSKSV